MDLRADDPLDPRGRLHAALQCGPLVDGPRVRDRLSAPAKGFSEIRRIIANLVEKRDQRRDGFAKVMANAFKQKLGDDAEEVAKVLHKHGISRDFAKHALGLAEKQGRFTIFTVVDALTKAAREYQNAGDRAELDEKAGALLALAA